MDIVFIFLFSECVSMLFIFSFICFIVFYGVLRKFVKYIDCFMYYLGVVFYDFIIE